ncbi:MAG: prolyl oligopeptidase family serine peptidase [Myxococcota bacterium]
MIRSLAVLLLLGCGATPAPVPQAAPDPAPVTASPPRHDDIVADLNTRALEGQAAYTLHGVEVSDPFRALETDSPFTQAWIEAQNARTANFLEAEDAGRRERLDALLSIGSIGSARWGGEHLFFSMRPGDEERASVYVKEESGERRIIDSRTLGERGAIDWYFPSPRGTYVAYGVSDNGDEASTLRVVNVETLELLDLTIPRTKWCNLAWLPDESGFYYTRYPGPGEPGYDEAQPLSYFPAIYFHGLGSAPEADPRVFVSERGTDFPGPHVSPDGRYLTLTVFRGWSASDVLLFDRGRNGRAAPDETHRIVPVVEGEDSISEGGVFDGRLILRTNRDAPRYRIVEANVRRPNRWRDLVPQGEGTIEDWSVSAGGAVVTHAIKNVRSELRVTKGRSTRTIDLPEGAVRSLAASGAHGRVALRFEGYTATPRVLTIDTDGDESAPETVVAIDGSVDLSGMVVTRQQVRSADGTEVPLTLVHRGELPTDGSAQVILYGYGGFNVSLLPRFTRHTLYWLESGGIYAVANLRGGGEFGEAWHQAGALANKANVFDDFEAAARHLSTTGVSTPERIAIMGGSNGGLLMGAMITRAPDAFGAAAAYVGLYDMVRYHRFPPAELWISEYGSAEDESLFPVLHGYSPYHRVEAGAAYPAVLIETADHDGRVHWAHSTKFAAALQHAAPDGSIYFHMARAEGHGAGSSRADMVEKYVRLYAFLERTLQRSTENSTESMDQ